MYINYYTYLFSELLTQDIRVFVGECLYKDGMLSRLMSDREDSLDVIMHTLALNDYNEPRLQLLHILLSDHVFDIVGNSLQDIVLILTTREGCELIDEILHQHTTKPADLGRNILPVLQQLYQIYNHACVTTEHSTEIQTRINYLASKYSIIKDSTINYLQELRVRYFTNQVYLPFSSIFEEFYAILFDIQFKECIVKINGVWKNSYGDLREAIKIDQHQIDYWLLSTP